MPGSANFNPMKLSRTWIVSLRWFLLIGAGLVTLFALAYTVELWRGRRAWAAVERDLRARGEPLDFAALEQPRVSDARNFFKAPLMEEIFFGREDAPPLAQLRTEAKLAGIMSAMGEARSITDFAALRTVFVRHKLIEGPSADQPAADILAGIAAAAPMLDALRQAAHERPEAWRPSARSLTEQQINADTIYHLGQLLALRAGATLALGRADDASADLWSVLRIARVLPAGPPTLLNVLVGEGLCDKAAEILKQGCLHHQWSEPQLRAFQQAWLEFQPLRHFTRAIQSERAGAIYYLSGSRTEKLSGLWPRWLIGGWVDQNKATLVGFISTISATIDPTAERVFPERVAHLQETAERLKRSRSPYDWFSRMFVGNFSRIVSGFGQNVNGNQQAILACALERYRVRHDRYPDSLAALSPDFLAAPVRDVLDGKPIRYARTEEGFTLGALDSAGKEQSTTWAMAR